MVSAIHFSNCDRRLHFITKFYHCFFLRFATFIQNEKAMIFGKKKDKLYFNPGNRESAVNEEELKKEVINIDEDDVEVVMSNEKKIAKKFSGANSLGKYVELGEIMMGMLKDMKKGSYTNVPWFTIATIVLALLYVLNPMDIIPDFIPGIGYIDDLAILTTGVGWIESDLHRYLDWKIADGQEVS